MPIAIVLHGLTAGHCICTAGTRSDTDSVHACADADDDEEPRGTGNARSLPDGRPAPGERGREGRGQIRRTRGESEGRFSFVFRLSVRGALARSRAGAAPI
jgi:hypothetical protein